jgi:hypothetical protein
VRRIGRRVRTGDGVGAGVTVGAAVGGSGVRSSGVRTGARVGVVVGAGDGVVLRMKRRPDAGVALGSGSGSGVGVGTSTERRTGIARRTGAGVPYGLTGGGSAFV